MGPSAGSLGSLGAALGDNGRRGPAAAGLQRGPGGWPGPLCRYAALADPGHDAVWGHAPPIGDGAQRATYSVSCHLSGGLGDAHCTAAPTIWFAGADGGRAHMAHDRTGAALAPRGFSVGAARIQSDQRAAGGPAGQPLRAAGNSSRPAPHGRPRASLRGSRPAFFPGRERAPCVRPRPRT